MTFLRRQVGDAISTVEMVDPDLDGAMALCAGWRLDGERLGAPNEGYVPVAGQLLRAVLDDPRVGWWFWLDPNASKAVH